MSHVKRKHDNVYAPPTLRIQLQIWPIVASITELTMHTELNCSKSLSFCLASLCQLWVSAVTHAYMHAPIYGCARTHWHAQTAYAHTRHARTAHARTFTHIHTHWNACMHTHTHTPGPGKHCHYGHLSPCGTDNMEATAESR